MPSLRSESFGFSFVLALTAADATYTIGQFAEVFALNAPKSGGLADGIWTTDLVMILVMFVIYWPVALVITLPPALIAFAYYRWSGKDSLTIFIAVGASIGLLAATLAFMTVMKWLSDEPGWPTLAYFFTSVAPMGTIAGAVGGYVYRQVALGRLARAA